MALAPLVRGTSRSFVRLQLSHYLFCKAFADMEMMDSVTAPAKKSFHIAVAAGIPRYRAGHGVRKALVSTLKPMGCKKVRVDHNSEGHARGWAWLFFPTAELRDTCCANYHDGITISIPAPANSSALPTSFTLTLQPCASMKMCQTFPSLTAPTHAELRLDPEAYFSISDEYTADDMTSACISLLNCLPAAQRSGIAVDGTGGGGGNTASLIRMQQFASILSYEVHPERAVNLKHNLHVLFGSYPGCNVLNKSCLSDIFDHRSANNSTFLPQLYQVSPDLLFLDPPWGGTNYRTVLTENQGVVEYYLSHENDQVSLTRLLSDIVVTENFCGLFKLIAVKLPSELSTIALCRSITSLRKWWKESPSGDIIASTDPNLLDLRPHPFRLQTGARTCLLLVAYPPYFKNSQLNSLVTSLINFDRERGNEFHPKYYDWEKDKWISLRSWKGCTMRCVNT